MSRYVRRPTNEELWSMYMAGAMADQGSRSVADIAQDADAALDAHRLRFSACEFCGGDGCEVCCEVAP